MSKAGAAQKAAPDTSKAITRWLDEVQLYEKDAKPWQTRGEQIVKRYRDQRDSARDVKRKYNILYSITETLRPALFARNPKPDIQRRFKDADPIGRVTSDILERAATYFVDTDHFSGGVRSAVMDYLLPGRATMWVRYVPHMKPADIPKAEGEVTNSTGPGTDEPAEVIDYEEVATDYVHLKDFGHNICRTWDECWLVWRIVYLDFDQLKARFGEELAAKIPLDHVQKDNTGNSIENAKGSKASIYEAWDKTRKVAVWFHKDVPEYLDLRPDPLKLQHFFPCPKPMFANLANDGLIPTPFFVEYQDQANELDNLTARIASISKSLKVAGVRDASAEGLDRLLSEGTENKLLPVQAWAMFAEKGGINGAIAFLPLEQIVSALASLYEAREKVKQDLYDITGIADIVRGQTNAQETMGAQQIKSNFATMRLGDHQRAVQEFVRDIVRIVVEVIANRFQAETIAQISGVRLLTGQEKQAYKAAQAAQAQQQPQQQPGMAPQSPAPQPPLPPNTSPDQFEQMMNDPTWEEVIGLMRNQPARCFRIDIETDSTIKADEQQEKTDRVEFLKAAGGFLSEAAKAGQENPQMAPLLGQMLMFGVRGFRVGKELEGAFNTAIQKMERAAANPQPKPNPEMAKVQGEIQLNREKAEAEIHVAQATQAAQAQQSTLENQQQHDREMAKIAAEERLAMHKASVEGDLQLKIAHIKAAAQIEVARITAAASDGAEAEKREAAGESA